MSVIGRWIKRLALCLLALVLVLGAPVGYVELGCRGTAGTASYQPVLPIEAHRPENRTLMTYPEWHIVHAYDDYAEVIRTGDPHEYGFLRAIGGFWTSLCDLKTQAAAHGGVDGGTKQMVYVIGVSFTAELAFKAAYEETLGRLATLLRGSERSPLDDVSAQQAADYARFLQQVPWYKWDFNRDAAALQSRGGLRDLERKLALGLEYRAKAAYAGVIADAVAATGVDALRLQMVVTGLSDDMVTRYGEVALIERRAEGAVIETPRYRALTLLMAQMAAEGVQFVEIAGNDDILLTLTSPQPERDGALVSFRRQGYGDYRHLLMVKVSDLATVLTQIAASGARLEHIHDY